MAHRPALPAPPVRSVALASTPGLARLALVDKSSTFAILDGLIYFIQAVDGGPIKIGVTDQHPNRRLEQFQAGCPVKLCVLGTTPGDQWAEDRLHKRFAAHRLHGEWFEPVDELVEVATMNPPKLAAWMEQYQDADGPAAREAALLEIMDRVGDWRTQRQLREMGAPGRPGEVAGLMRNLYMAGRVRRWQDQDNVVYWTTNWGA